MSEKYYKIALFGHKREEILDALNDEWQPTELLVSKLGIKELKAIRFLPLALHELENHGKILYKKSYGKEYWKVKGEISHLEKMVKLFIKQHEAMLFKQVEALRSEDKIFDEALKKFEKVVKKVYKVFKASREDFLELLSKKIISKFSILSFLDFMEHYLSKVNSHIKEDLFEILKGLDKWELFKPVYYKNELFIAARLGIALTGRRLTIVNKKIEEISEIKDFDKLTDLIKLDLSNNNISNVKGLENLKNLESLNLSQNNLSEIKGLENLKNLKSLNLSQNNLSEVKALKNLENLEYLNLNDNNIYTLPSSLEFKFFELKISLELSGNPISKDLGFE